MLITAYATSRSCSTASKWLLAQVLMRTTQEMRSEHVHGQLPLWCKHMREPSLVCLWVTSHWGEIRCVQVFTMSPYGYWSVVTIPCSIHLRFAVSVSRVLSILSVGRDQMGYCILCSMFFSRLIVRCALWSLVCGGQSMFFFLSGLQCLSVEYSLYSLSGKVPDGMLYLMLRVFQWAYCLTMSG